MCTDTNNAQQFGQKSVKLSWKTKWCKSTFSCTVYKWSAHISYQLFTLTIARCSHVAAHNTHTFDEYLSPVAASIPFSIVNTAGVGPTVQISQHVGGHTPTRPTTHETSAVWGGPGVGDNPRGSQRQAVEGDGCAGPIVGWTGVLVTVGDRVINGYLNTESCVRLYQLSLLQHNILFIHSLSPFCYVRNTKTEIEWRGLKFSMDVECEHSNERGMLIVRG